MIGFTGIILGGILFILFTAWLGSVLGTWIAGLQDDPADNDDFGPEGSDQLCTELRHDRGTGFQPVASTPESA